MYQRESRMEWGRGQIYISAYVGTAACLSHEGGIYPQHGGRGGLGSVLGSDLPQLIAVKNSTMMCCWTFFPPKYSTIEARLLYHGPRGAGKKCYKTNFHLTGSSKRQISIIHNIGIPAFTNVCFMFNCMMSLLCSFLFSLFKGEHSCNQWGRRLESWPTTRANLAGWRRMNWQVWFCMW